jgi:hypothetical protein
LHLAGQTGNVDLVRLLIGHGADATVMDKHGHIPRSTPSHRASFQFSRA